MKALAIIPAYSHIDPDLMMALLEAGVPFFPLYGSSDLPRTRSTLITIALAQPEPPERLLFIDSDIVPTAAQIATLATSELVTPEQALTGLYPIRDRRATLAGGASWAVDAIDPEAAAAGAPLFRARWAGLGFAAIHADSLRRLAAELHEVTAEEMRWWPFCLPFVEDGVYYPDDRALWCRLARIGTGLLAASALKVGHVARVVLTEVK